MSAGSTTTSLGYEPFLKRHQSQQQRVRSWQGIAVLVKVTKERQAPVLQRRGPIFVLAVEARDEVVHEL